MRASWPRLWWCAPAFLSLTGCALEAVDEADELEAVAEAAQALSTYSVASYASTGLDPTNGKKVVYAGGVLHAVYAVGGAVKYVSSNDGITWTAPVNIDTNSAINPALAVASDGTIGIVYVRNASSGAGNIFYAYKLPTPNASWQAAQITPDGSSAGSRTPSIATRNNRMYVAWVKQPRVRYASFSANMSDPPGTAEIVNPTVTTYLESYLPAVMVGPGPSGTTSIRVAFYEKLPPDAQGIKYIPMHIAERGASGWPAPVETIPANWAFSVATATVSADVNPTTGDAYVLSSVLIDGVSQSTWLTYENTLTPGYNFQHTTLNNSATVSDVIARTEGCQSRFRVVLSTPYNGHGQTSYRTGTWTGSGGITWLHPTVALSGSRRAVGALMGSEGIPNTSQSRFFYGLHEEKLGPSSYELGLDVDEQQTPAPCQ